MKQQHGSALIISLLILLVMTMIGISAMSTATMEERMAANDRNQKVAFLSAEAGIKEAETTIARNNTYQTLQENLANEQSGVYRMGELNNTNLFDQNEWQAGAGCTATTQIKNQTQPAPCYKVELLAEHSALTAGGYGESEPVSQLVRITTRGTDSAGIAAALIQTHFEYELVQ